MILDMHLDHQHAVTVAARSDIAVKLNEI